MARITRIEEEDNQTTDDVGRKEEKVCAIRNIIQHDLMQTIVSKELFMSDPFQAFDTYWSNLTNDKVHKIVGSSSNYFD